MTSVRDVMLSEAKHLCSRDPSPTARLRMTIAAVAFLFAGCRTTRPPNAEPLAPLTSNTPAEAAQQLALRRSEFRGERSLIRLRLPKISARGQLQVDSAGRMLMTMYTPIGTNAARLYVDGDQVIFLNDLQSTAWRGKASELAGSLGAFANSELPLLLIGQPVTGVNDITYAPSGIQSVRLSDITVSFDPPVYPPKTVVIDRAGQQVAIEHLDSFVDPEAVKAPEIPSGYSCCVLPQI